MNLPEQHRIMSGEGSGLWVLPFEGRELTVVASGRMGWEHASVSLKNRCPNWREMCFVKDFFWDPEDVVMQLHPAKSEYVNMHRYCLHLWRPIGIGVKIPTPPSILVGIK